MASIAWTEHRNAEGRTYWYNPTSKESVWEKPEDLKTPFERALAKTEWKEYFSGGRKYYYHTATKESKWEMPDELLLILEKVEKENGRLPPPVAVPRPAPNFTPGGGPPIGSAQLQGATHPTNFMPPPGTNIPAQAPLGLNGVDGALVRPGTVAPSGMPLPTLPSSVPPRPALPDDPVIPHNGFATAEEAEKAFNHLLRKSGVDATWSWEQTMRAIITDPLYKSYNTLAERKTAWKKYTDNLRAKEAEEKDARLNRLRPSIRNMLKGNPNVFHYTTFKTADSLFSQHPIWQQAKIESERRLLFEEYVQELRLREEAAARERQVRSMEKIVALFKMLDVDVLTRWRTAQMLVLDSDEWKNDKELQMLPALDMLHAFEDYSSIKEREYAQTTKKAETEKTKKERKARDAFKELLHGLVESKRIVAKSKWKDVFPLFAEDERYLGLLGVPGSNPLELFWDAVDQLDQQLDVKVNLAEKVLQARGVASTTEMTVEAFRQALKDDASLTNLKDEDMTEIFNHVHGQLVRQKADEKRRADRKAKHMQEDLRYALKKVAGSIDVNATFEDALPVIQDLEEFKALEDDESRKNAFAKFVKRQKEKLRELSEDGGSSSGRKRKEPHGTREAREREHEHDERDRDDRNGSRHNHRGDYERERRDSRDYRRSDREHDYRSSGGRHRSDSDRRGTYSRKDDRDRDRRRDTWDSPSDQPKSGGRSAADEKDGDVEMRYTSASPPPPRKTTSPPPMQSPPPRGSPQPVQVGRDDSPEEGEI